jgi:hypothetical protein
VSPFSRTAHNNAHSGCFRILSTTSGGGVPNGADEDELANVSLSNIT